MINKRGIVILLACSVAGLWGCSTPEGPATATGEKKDSVLTTTNDTIPETRSSVSKKAVASYYTTVGDPKLDRKFGLSIYETSSTFNYIMRMQYEAVLATDTLRLPNFGTWPKVEIHPGKTGMSCIIGFLDQKGQFKEYKMLSAEGNKMKLEALKKYGVGRYSTPK